MLSADATVTDLYNTADDFTWVFDYVKANTEQLRTHFQSKSCNTTCDYKTTFFINGPPVIITTWLYNDCAKPVEQMNEIVMMEYRKLFEIT